MKAFYYFLINDIFFNDILFECVVITMCSNNKYAQNCQKSFKTHDQQYTFDNKIDK